MNASLSIERPVMLAGVTRKVDFLAAFGLNLRDWQHAIQRDGVRSRAVTICNLKRATCNPGEACAKPRGYAKNTSHHTDCKNNTLLLTD